MRYGVLITEYSLRKIRKYFFSSLLVVVGISIGIGGIFAAVAAGGSVQNSINVEFARQNVASMSITADGVTPEMRDIIAAIPNIEVVELRLLYKTDFYYNNSWKRFILIGIPDVTNIKISKFTGEPSWELSEDSIILESSVEELGIQKGESIRFFSPEGPVVLIVAGYRRNSEFLSYSYSGEIVGYCQLETAEKVSGFTLPNCIAATVEDTERIDETYRAVLAELDAHNISVISLEKNTPQDYSIRGLLTQTQLLIIMISFMVLLSACIFLWNSTTALLLEEKREIQVMEAVGLSKRHRFLMYFPSKLYLVIAGTMIGLPLGWWAHQYLTTYFCDILNIGAHPVFDVNALVLGVFLGIVFSSIFLIIPTFLGIRDTRESKITLSPLFLRLLKLFKGSLTLNISFSSVMIHKARTFITVVGLAFLITLFIVIQSTGTSIRTTLNEEIYDIRSYDFYVYFDLPIESQPEISHFINSQEDVKHFEYWYVKGGFIDDNSVQIVGVPKDTRIYKSKIAEGRYFGDSHQNEVLVSIYLSRRASINVGDTILVEVGAKKIDFNVVGVILDADHDGKTMLVPIETLQELTDSTGKITHIMIDVTPSAEENSENVGMSIKEGLLSMNIHGTIRTKNESKEKTENMTKMFLLLFYSFLVLVGVIVFINTAYALTLNVINREDELKLLSVLGANMSAIFKIILATSVILAIPAWILSLIFGPYLSEVFVQYVSATMLPISYTFSQGSIILGLLLDLIISFLGALYSIGYVFFKFSF